MLCDIYRSKVKPDWYLAVPSGVPIPALPEYVLAQLGELALFKTREIQQGQPLIGASADDVLKNIAQYGFHAQGIQVKTEVSEAGAALGGGVLGGSIAGPVGAVIGAVIGYGLAQQAKEKQDVF